MNFRSMLNINHNEPFQLYRTDAAIQLKQKLRTEIKNKISFFFVRNRTSLKHTLK